MSTGTTPPRRSEDWAWLDNDFAAPTADDAVATPPDGSSVAAVLVVHDAEAWLSDTVASIAALRPAPVAVIAVDVGSSDRSRELLQQAVSAGDLTSVVTSSATDSLADAFAVGIAEVEKDLEAQWFWFLHDDVQPRTDALGELLTATEREPEVAVWVPTLLEPERRNHATLIQSLGNSVSPTGRRIESGAVGDIDQGQNEPQRVLGGSSAGLMVRADSYHHLGGFLSLSGWHRAGVDLGWRATCAGQVVSTCPTARLHHLQAGLTGLRQSGDTDPRLDDRLAGVRLVAARTTRWGQLAMFFALMGSALLLLIGKAATRARHELLAGWSLLSDRARIAQLREQSSRTNTEPPNDRCRELRPGWGRSLVALLDGWVTSTPSRSTGRDDGASLDELTGDDFSASGGDRSTRSLPFLVGCAAVAVTSLVAVPALWGVGSAQAAALLPAPQTWGAAWDAWLRPQPGLAGDNAPWLGLAALASTVFLGHPEWWARAALGLAVPAAYLSAHHALGASFSAEPGHDRAAGWIRVLISLVWAAQLPPSGMVRAGSIPGIAAAVLLPLGWAAWDRGRRGTRRLRPAPRWQATGVLVLVAMLLMSLQPLAWCLLVLVVLTWWGPTDHRRAQSVMLLVAPLLFLLPWAPRLVTEPTRLLTGPDPIARGWVGGGGPAVLIGRLWPQPATEWWLVATAGGGVLLAVLLVAVASRARRIGAAPVAVAGLGFGLAAWLPRVVLSLDGQPVSAAPELWYLLGVGALLILTADRVGEVDPSWLRSTISGLLLVAVVLGFVSYVADAFDATSNGALIVRSALPSYLLNAEDSPLATRTLLVDISGDSARWSVSSATAPQWGSGEQPAFGNPQLQSAVAGVAQQIASGRVSDDLSATLQELAVAYVWLHGADAERVAQITAAPGIRASFADTESTILSLEEPVSRAGLLGTDARLRPVLKQTVSGAADGDTLVIADAADQRFTASIGGVRLEQMAPVDARQQFGVAGKSGELTYSVRRSVWGPLLQGMLLLVALLAAAPTARGQQHISAPPSGRPDREVSG